MIGNAQEVIQWLFNQDSDKRFEIKEYREKRSLNANKYAWALITEIANVLRTDKDTIYLNMLKRYGQHEIISVLANIDIRSYFKYYEVAGEADLQGKHFIHYRIFKGSSEYDTREMAILIDGIIADAKELGIDVLPPDEVERLKSLWQI